MLATRALRMAHGPKPNITGFNIRAFKESTGQPRYDPWERALVYPLFPLTIPITKAGRQTRQDERLTFECFL
ncbi:nadh-ubiquinone oxidoreductase b12 subunit, partial [Trichoderma arundinaceum]